MVAVTKKKLSQLMVQVREEFGNSFMEERSYGFRSDWKETLQKRLFEDNDLPELAPFAVNRISTMDGYKVYFENGGWLLIRFSGTEPLLRVFCEMPREMDAIMLCDRVKTHFGI